MKAMRLDLSVRFSVWPEDREAVGLAEDITVPSFRGTFPSLLDIVPS
jgi:hypothetical protein